MNVARWRRGLRFAQRWLLNMAAALGALCLLGFLVCVAFGLRPAVVISGSMEPAYPVGSVTFAKTVPVSEIRVGDVVTLPRNDGNGLVTHRVIKIERGLRTDRALVLQGDANREPDLLPYEVAQAGRVVAVIPLAGYLVQAVQANFFLAVAVLVSITLLAAIPIKETHD
ncbi:MAG: signal peptidase I [Propionibacteriaceae bacterium]|jgi:signal peptidase|nr:signal peptidase I [Propionibacteriaceae bacterium]